MNRLHTAVLALVLVASPAGGLERAYVIDGDTIRVAGESIRVMGLDAPEMRGECPRERQRARDARDRLAELVTPGVILERHGRDRYGRGLAVVRDYAGRDVARVLIEEGLARYYNGRGRRQGWC